MVTVSFELPEDVFSSVRKDPDSFAEELRLAAAVKWYEIGLVSQGRAAEISGLSRSQFISALGRFEVSAFQYDVAEIIEEVNRE
ncbi:MAG: UPF0175 family protein [Gemmatimonadetes bacterium]|nr:UPF0175 family protein [Gemmatimonadota bacterium]MYB67692.1 UPF0175 family protein [Gemmatimonadota bacterium]